MYAYHETNGSTSFKRYCKTLELKNDPALIAEYKKAHSQGSAWIEISQGMIDVGIIDMEIYIVGTRLFMIMDTLAEFNHDMAMAALAMKPRQSEWETFVSKYQKTSAESNASEKWILVERIYKLGE